MGRVEVKSSALFGSVRNADREAPESRVQITSVVSGFAHESCTGAAVSHDSGFEAVTSSVRATVRRTLNCITVHLSKLGKRRQCVLYAARSLQLAAPRVCSSYREQISSLRATRRVNLETIATVVLDTRRYSSLRLEAASAHCSKSRGY